LNTPNDAKDSTPPVTPGTINIDYENKIIANSIAIRQKFEIDLIRQTSALKKLYQDLDGAFNKFLDSRELTLSDLDTQAQTVRLQVSGFFSDMSKRDADYQNFNNMHKQKTSLLYEETLKEFKVYLTKFNKLSREINDISALSQEAFSTKMQSPQQTALTSQIGVFGKVNNYIDPDHTVIASPSCCSIQ